jgi:cytoskeleton protein RodZ
MSEEHALPQDGDDLSPGAMLARARAVRQLGISEVAERLKYGARQIEALEADDYGRLPGTTFVRGMIRGYSKLVGMDPAPALKALERRNIPAQATVDLRTKRIPFPDGNKRATRLYLVLSVITLLAIVVVLYEWHFAEVPPAPVAVNAVPAAPRPAPQAAVAALVETKNVAPITPAAPATPVTPLTPVAMADTGKAPASRGNARRIQLEFQRESWVEIKDRAGRTLLSQLNPAGTQKVVEGAPPFSVIIGNAANVRVTYKDASVDLMPYVKVEVARLTLE